MAVTPLPSSLGGDRGGGGALQSCLPSPPGCSPPGPSLVAARLLEHAPPSRRRPAPHMLGGRSAQPPRCSPRQTLQAGRSGRLPGSAPRALPSTAVLVSLGCPRTPSTGLTSQAIFPDFSTQKKWWVQSPVRKSSCTRARPKPASLSHPAKPLLPRTGPCLHPLPVSPAPTPSLGKGFRSAGSGSRDCDTRKARGDGPCPASVGAVSAVSASH